MSVVVRKVWERIWGVEGVAGSTDASWKTVALLCSASAFSMAVFQRGGVVATMGNIFESKQVSRIGERESGIGEGLPTYLYSISHGQ